MIHQHDQQSDGVVFIDTLLSITSIKTTALLVSGFVLLVTVLYIGSKQQGIPLNKIGLRTKGRGLLEWIYYYYFFPDQQTVTGYDPILGSFSPPLRFLVHCSSIMIVCALLTLIVQSLPDIIIISFLIIVLELLSLIVQSLPDTMTITYFHMGMITIFIYCGWFLYLFYILPGVSQPGPPRKHKIERYPQWENRSIPFPKNTTPLNSTKGTKNSNHMKWRYVTGQQGHVVTDKLFSGTSGFLTGEPAGRDIWTTESDQSHTNTSTNTHGVDDKLLQEIAAGGRTPLVFNPAVNPNSCDMLVREQLIRTYLASGKSLPTTPKTPNKGSSQYKTTITESITENIDTALYRAVHFYSMLQTEDGHWTGDYGGPHFLMPGLVIAWYVMGKPLKMFHPDEIQLIKHYMIVHQQIDGGWGTHIESPSTMFGTVMQYVSLRLLGLASDDPVCVNGRRFIQDNGGAVMAASWSKFYLCLLGCMEWDGHNSVPPEMWLLPNWFPFHPGRMWCHARMVYLPMGYLYGIRFVYKDAATDPIIQSLRSELYCTPYNTISWMQTRHMVAPMDNYSPIPLSMKLAQNALARYETWSIFQPFKNYIRQLGVKFCAKYMAAEDLQTNFICIGPVNKVLNMISAYCVAESDIEHPNVVNHIMRVADFLWVAEDGMKMKGYNGSQCWDTSFAIQAIYEAGLLDEFPDVTANVWSYLERCQILSTDVSHATAAYQYESAKYRKLFYRHVSEGGWPFSTSAHGWPISDCTGEGLKGVLCLLKSKTVKDGIKQGQLKPITEERLHNAVNVLLTYQNEDGGFATYENTRGFGWYESLNPSEVFGDIMIDYSYVECSMAALTALVEFRNDYPHHRPDDVSNAIDMGRSFIKSIQREDGSWYGNWACCFCYACWFGIEGLVKCGEPLSSDRITKACEFLLSHQRPNGGWGEDFTSCYDKDYSKDGMKDYGDDGSGVVNTGWALLALSAAKCQNIHAIQLGVKYLLQRQLPYGDWPQEGIAGVFNRACGITYTAYRNVFPIWAIGRCRATYGSALDDL